MSIQTWLAEFTPWLEYLEPMPGNKLGVVGDNYEIDYANMGWHEALTRCLNKWKGLAEVNLRRHGMTPDQVYDLQLIFDDTCPCCTKVGSSSACHSGCPIYLSLGNRKCCGGECGDSETDGDDVDDTWEYSAPWSVYYIAVKSWKETEPWPDSAPMVKAIEAAIVLNMKG